MENCRAVVLHLLRVSKPRDTYRILPNPSKLTKTKILFIQRLNNRTFDTNQPSLGQEPLL